MQIKVKRLKENAKLPSQMSDEAAGFDLYSLEKKVVKGLTRFDLGISLQIPPGFEGVIRSRSGLAFHYFVRVFTDGTIDSDYRGEIAVLLENYGVPYRIEEGERIAQLVIRAVPEVSFSWTGALGKTKRGGKGFGSTDSGR